MEEKIYTLEEIENVKEGKSFLKVRYSCCECGADIVKKYCIYKEKLKENKLYCKDCGFKNHRNWKAEHEKARKILAENRKKLDELAMYLYEKETITGDEFMDILDRK